MALPDWFWAGSEPEDLQDINITWDPEKTCAIYAYKDIKISLKRKIIFAPEDMSDQTLYDQCIEAFDQPELVDVECPFTYTSLMVTFARLHPDWWVRKGDYIETNITVPWRTP